MSQKPIEVVVKTLQEKKIPIKAEGDTRGSIEVDKTKLVETAKVLREVGFDHVKAVTGIDFPDQSKFQVIYHVSSFDLELSRVILALKTWTSYKDPVVPSLINVWGSVWTGERETYEMLGITFEGNPDMRRLFLPEDFEGVYPLRKSFKIRTEGLFVDKSS
ncbi:NADH-quinone oxidoreductase subunit C [Metallosphaera hakonensis]|uniref:NADH-quinone oxidoreductase subunit C n=1 Tax=Metallosphaera hakonensis JCM 8857 = DSM 7519 TaxID=1293036 RepID=A0A2U9IUY4_9CREN|nr:NADH-quinone oxidoreductase subunit C [Metallosphaera hakonensis]AWR99814.1 NADH-quinone oxidoreductase subunit C [Metallosphaera hakonensis JCM 8857 = DSM 7519]